MERQIAHLTMSGHVVSFRSLVVFDLTHQILVLDPRIRYSGLVADCEGDTSSLRELKKAKDNLEQYFCSHYCAPPSRPSTPPLTSSPTDFTAHYETLPVESVDEWEEFLTLKRESFPTCGLIWCWGGRSSIFPKLSKLARDILSMPGMSLLSYAIHFLT